MATGYRLLAEFGQGKCLLKTRNGANATSWFPENTRPLSNIKLFPEGPYIVDGEVCVIADHGRTDFDRLHARARRRSRYGGCDHVTFCMFDSLTANGVDQTQLAYLERKERLQRLFKPSPPGSWSLDSLSRVGLCANAATVTTTLRAAMRGNIFAPSSGRFDGACTRV
jgi:bifunctional non-homologous end joining protein LigD